MNQSMEQESFPHHPLLTPRRVYRFHVKIRMYAPRALRTYRIGNSDCLTFFDYGENAYLIDGRLAEEEKFQLIYSNSTALGVIGGGSVMTEYGNFRFNLGPGEDWIRSQL